MKSHVIDACEIYNEMLGKPMLDDNYYFRLLSNTEIEEVTALIKEDYNHLRALQINTDIVEEKIEPKVEEISIETYTEVYKITASDSKLDELQEYLSSHGFNWELVD